MKQRILGMVLLGILMIGHPAEAAFGGFRIGGMLGVQYLKGRHWYTGGSFSPNNDTVARLGTISSLYGITAGYLVEMGASKIVLGGEVYAFLPQANPTLNLGLYLGPQEGTVAIQHTRSIGFVVTAGMMLNPKVMAYLNAGLEQARYQFKYNFLPTAGTYLTPGYPPLPNQQILHHIFKAIMVGLGATYKVTPHLLLGLEASAPFFKRFKARTEAPRAFSYKPVEWRVALKLSYLF